MALVALQVRLGVRGERAAGGVERRHLADALDDVVDELLLAAREAHGVGRDDRRGEPLRSREGATRAKRVAAVEVTVHGEREAIAERVAEEARVVVAHVVVRRAPEPLRVLGDEARAHAGEAVSRHAFFGSSRLAFGVKRVARGEDAAAGSCSRRDPRRAP